MQLCCKHYFGVRLHSYAYIDGRDEGADEHKRGEAAEALRSNRTYRDEVSGESLRAADDILRVWLPPVLLEKLAVPEA